MSTKWPSTSMRDSHEKAYLLWKGIWSETFRELKGLDQLPSNDWLIKDEALVLYFQDNPIGLYLLSWHSLEQDCHRDEAYFDLFPADLLKQLLISQNLSPYSGRFMTLTYLTVHPEWRKKTFQPRVSELLTEFAIRRFEESQSAFLLGCTRNDRKVNKLGQDHGFDIIFNGLTVLGIESDVVLYRSQNHRPSPLHATLMNRIWEQREHDQSMQRLINESTTQTSSERRYYGSRQTGT